MDGYFLDVTSFEEELGFSSKNKDKDQDVCVVVIVNLEKKIKHIIYVETKTDLKLKNIYIDISTHDLTYKSYIPISLEVYNKLINLKVSFFLNMKKKDLLVYLKLHEWTI
jgi:hypothetical protein